MRLAIVKGIGLVGLGAALSPAQASVVQIVANAAQQNGVPLNVAMGVASHESQFIPTAQNPGSSAAGVMQLMSVTQQTLGVTNPYDPTQNVNAGVSLLAKYYQQYGDWNKALQAYSDGPGTVNQGLPPSQQTLGLISYVNAYDPTSALAAAGVDTGTPSGSTLTAGGPVTDSGTGGGSGVDYGLLGADLGASLGSNGGIDWGTVGLIALAAVAGVVLS